MYCRNCGQWNDDGQLRQGDGRCAACGTQLTEAKKKDNKTVYILLAVIVLLLLALVILLLVKFLQKKNAPPADDPNTVAVSVAEKEEAFRSAIHITDVSAYPDCRTSGYIETYVGDLTGDSEPEYLAFYGDFANEDAPTVDVHLYDFDAETNEAVLVYEIDEAFDVKPRNGSLSLCIYVDDGDLCVRRSGYGNGGSMWFTRDLRFSVENDTLTPVYDFDEYVNNGVNNIYHFTENVSGETYSEPAEIQTAREARGVDDHTHGVNDRSFFPENHILVLYRNSSFDEPGETGYLLLRYLRDTFSPADTTEAETEPATETEATTEPTTAAPTSAPTRAVDIAEVWQQTNGSWGLPSENFFFQFSTENGEYIFVYGVFASDVFRVGTAGREIVRNADNTLSVHVDFPASTGELIAEAYSTTVMLDLSEIDQGRLSIWKDDSGWTRYDYIGASYESIEQYFIQHWTNN